MAVPDATLVTLTLMMILSVGGLAGSGSVGGNSGDCGKPPSRYGIFCSFCAMTPTRTTVTVCFASAGRGGLVPECAGKGRCRRVGLHAAVRAGRGSRWSVLRLVWGFMVCAAPGRGICGCGAGWQLEHRDLTLGGGFVYAPATAQGDVSERSRIFPGGGRLSPWPSARCC